MKRRIFAFITVAVMLVSAAVPAGAAWSDYKWAKYREYAAGITDTVRDFGAKYVFDTGISAEDLSDIMTIVYNENPELFYLDSNYNYSYGIDSVTGEQIVQSFIPKYRMDRAEYEAKLAEVENWVENVVSLTDPSFTDYEYALFFHDYIAANFEYDLAYEVRDVYDSIKKGRGVCQSYAYLYMLLLDRVEIENSYAQSREMSHVWNLVKIDGEWYHVDVTWDDPVGINPGGVRHRHFMKSDSAMADDVRDHYGWVSPYACDSDRYDGSAVDEVSSSFVYMDDMWYFIKDGVICTADSPEGGHAVFADGYKYNWNVWDSAAYYTANYSVLMGFGGDLYITTPESVVKVVQDGEGEAVYTYKGGAGYVYGMTVDAGADEISGAGFPGGDVIVHVSKAPGDEGIRIPTNLGEVKVTFPKGDANGDGKVNLSDASLMMKYIAGWDVSPDMDAADFDGNGKVNLSDVSNVLKLIAGWSASADGQISA